MINRNNTASDNNKLVSEWFIVDAKNLILGRLSSFLATRLMGKHKISYTDNNLCGDKIVIINAKKVILTGDKLNKKKFWHTGYPGGIKNKTIKEILGSKNSTSLLRNSVKNMLKKGPLGRQQLKNLYIYPNTEHPHAGQNPRQLSLN
ncbi:MAG: 50S ribosomal protein L13 [Alphaproteobacteria bacterium MarineAlpha6_Bin2]|nr:MAG: 50S ribosomal protein L13 [Alphaproteobacteria bacterium MarineAlpha6_Bin2]